MHMWKPWHRIRSPRSGGWSTAALAGAFFFLATGRVADPTQTQRLALLAMGALYGLAVLGLLRLFRVRAFGLVVAGLLAGPVPLAVLTPVPENPQDLGVLWLAAAVLGALIGTLDWMRLGSSSGREGPGTSATLD